MHIYDYSRYTEMMELSRKKIRDLYSHLMHDNLRRSSSLLILSQGLNAGTAFLFWIICAHLFNAKQVGLATTFVSYGGFVTAFTTLGLPNTIIRFLPLSKRKGGLFSAALMILTITSLIGGTIALALVNHLSNRLAFIQHDNVLICFLFLLVIGNSLSSLLDGTLLSFRKSEYVLLKALITNIPRIILPFFLVGFALKGLIGIFVIMILIGISYTLYIVIQKLFSGDSFKPALKPLVEHKAYALSNYFGGMLGILPSTIVPIIVLNKLGADQAAYFYMPMQIAAFLNIISSSVSQALISESSQTDNPNDYQLHIKNAVKNLYRMLFAAILVVVALGWPVLRVYGHSYVKNGYVLLLLLAAASVFVGVNWLGDTILNIQKRSVAFFFMNTVNAILVVTVVGGVARHGLTSVGIGWLLAQSITAVIYVTIFARRQFLDLFVRAKIVS